MTTTTSGATAGHYSLTGLLPRNYLVRLNASDFSGVGALVNRFLPNNNVNNDNNGVTGSGSLAGTVTKFFFSP